MRHFDLVDFESGRGEKRRPPRGVENTVVLARLFNEVQAEKMPSRMVRLILSEYLRLTLIQMIRSFYLIVGGVDASEGAQVKDSS
jgi:hypothetical protein